MGESVSQSTINSQSNFLFDYQFSYVYLNIYLSLFVCIGPEKPRWGVVNYAQILYIHFKQKVI